MSLLFGSPHFLQSIVETLHVISVSSSTAFLSHQSDFSARVRFCSRLLASLYAAVVDLVLLVCNTLWWVWSLLLIRVCSSWSLGSNQAWCFLSGLPRYVMAVLYTTCCRAAHSSSGVEFSFSSYWARALSISCSKLSLWLMVRCPLTVVLLSYSDSHFLPQHLVMGPAVSSTHGSGTLDVHLIPTPRDDEVDHMPVSGTRMHPVGLAFILLPEHGVRHYQL